MVTKAKRWFEILMVGIKYYYPIPIKSSIESLLMSDSGQLRKITDLELRKFFGISERKIDSNLRLVSSNFDGSGYYPLREFFPSMLDNAQSIFGSNYVFETTDKDEAELFNKAIKLALPSKSGLFLGFNSETSALHFIWPNPYIQQFDYALLNEEGKINSLKKLFEKIKEFRSDKKIDLLFDLYLNALSGNRERLGSKFIALTTILESLYSSDSRNEIVFRLSLRTARVLAKHGNMNQREICELISKPKDGLYSIRSEIVHSGESKSLSIDKFKELLQIVSESIKLFVSDQNIFSDCNLKNVIFE